LIQHIPHEFIITFAQIHPPITAGKNISDIEKIRSVQAKAAVRIALPPGRLKELIEVLSENHKNYLTNWTSGAAAEKDS
jgi:hypothetical protein